MNDEPELYEVDQTRGKPSIFLKIKNYMHHLAVRRLDFLLALSGFLYIVAGILFGMDGVSLLGVDFIVAVLISLSVINLLCIICLSYRYHLGKQKIVLLPLLSSTILFVVCILYILAIYGIYQTEFIASSPYILTTFFGVAGAVNFTVFFYRYLKNV